MDQISLVTDQLKDGQRLVDQLLQTGFPVTGACWAKTEDDSKWYLYLVSPFVEDVGITEAYGQIHPVIRQMPEPFSVDPFEVKALGPSAPLAQGLLEMQRRFPNRWPVRLEGGRLGRVNIEGAYLYPPPVPVASP